MPHRSMLRRLQVQIQLSGNVEACLYQVTNWLPPSTYFYFGIRRCNGNAHIQLHCIDWTNHINRMYWTYYIFIFILFYCSFNLFIYCFQDFFKCLNVDLWNWLTQQRATNQKKRRKKGVLSRCNDGLKHVNVAFARHFGIGYCRLITKYCRVTKTYGIRKMWVRQESKTCTLWFCLRMPWVIRSVHSTIHGFWRIE